MVTDDDKLLETLFGGGLIKAATTPDGTVDVNLISPSAEEVMNAASDLYLAWKDFRNLNVEGPCAIHDGKWWKALQWLALADSKMKDLFVGRDRSPRSIAMYHRYRLTIVASKKKLRADA
jgi:hypothetical protein